SGAGRGGAAAGASRGHRGRGEGLLLRRENDRDPALPGGDPRPAGAALTAMHWIIESAAFPATAEKVIAALERQGIAWSEYRDEDGPPRGPSDRRALFWGSLGAAYEERGGARFASWRGAGAP